jgi:RES domain-containing protein
MRAIARPGHPDAATSFWTGTGLIRMPGRFLPFMQAPVVYLLDLQRSLRRVVWWRS